MSKKEYNAVEKLAILKDFEASQTTFAEIAKKYGLGKTTLTEWWHRYKIYGYEGLEARINNKKYPAEIKIKAIQDYLSGKYSQIQIVDKYEMASRTQLRNWIEKYNDHNSCKSTQNGGKHAMVKGRRTDWQERIDIVLHCLSQNHDYQNSATRFQVSYQQVYQWVHKYENGGVNALRDGRGRKKTQEELSYADKQKLAMKKLEYENERLRAENALLKKLHQLQRGRS